MAAIRVLIVDDHALFADAIGPTLRRLGFEEIEHAARGDEGVEAARHRPPTLALIDLGLPDRSGLSIGQEILELGRATKVVVLTALDDQRTVERALAAGFDGYLTKNTSMARFASSIQAVLRGEAVFPRGSGHGRSREGAERDSLLLAQQLTPRECEVLRLLVQGITGDSLAGELGISPNTVRTHVQSILTKLHVHSRLEAATFAVRHGVVHPRSQRAAS